MLTELPEKWVVKITKESIDSINKYRNTFFNPAVEVGDWDYIKHTSYGLYERHILTDYRDYTEISFEDFKRLVLKEEKMYTKEQLISERITVFLENKKQWEELNSFLGFSVTTNYNGAYQYCPKERMYDSSSANNISVNFSIGYTNITFNQIQMNKKIIGYKAPMDLFEGEVKKGTIYNGDPKEAGSQKPNTYWIRDSCSIKYNLPKEIVETWEPVYEQQKLNKVGAHDVTYPSKTVVKIGCTEYEKSQLKGAEMLLETKNIKCIMCNDDTKIDIGIIRQLIQGLES